MNINVKKKILFILFGTVCAFLLLIRVFFAFRTFIVKIPDPFGIEKRKEYNALKNNPPEDLCKLEVEYDGFSPLPDKLIASDDVYVRFGYGKPWKVSDDSKYIGQMLVTPRGWNTYLGFGYCYSEVYTCQNKSGENICLLFSDVSILYVNSIIPSDVMNTELYTSCELFDGAEKINISEHVDQSVRLKKRSPTGLNGLVIAKSSSDVTSNPKRVVDIDCFVDNSLCFHSTARSLYTELHFYCFDDSYYLSFDGLDYLYQITDEAMISKLKSLIYGN